MLESYGLTDRGCVRSNNEDCFLLASDAGLYVIADGMGGALAGEEASHMASATVVESVRASKRRDTQILLMAVEEANRKVRESASLSRDKEGMGTTLVAALEVGDDIAIASVGDSRAYLFDENRLRAITEDQTWVAEVGRPLGIEEEALRNHPMRHVLTMAVGLGAPLAINYYSLRLKPGAQILLCTDGLHGVVSEELIEGILESQDTLEKKCGLLVESARKSGGPDNITCILLRAAV